MTATNAEPKSMKAMKAMKAAPKKKAMKAAHKKKAMKAVPKKKAMKAAPKKKAMQYGPKEELLAEINGTFDDRAFLSGHVRVSLPGEGKWWLKKVILELVLQEWDETNQWNSKWGIGPSAGFFRPHPRVRG
jgi:hypothetical protein